MKKNDPVNLSTARVISDTFFVSAARIGMTILKPIRGILLGRILGPELYGILIIPVPYVQILTLLSNIGFNTAVIRLIPGYRQKGDPESARMIYRSAGLLTLGLSIVWSALLFVLARWIAIDISHRPDAFLPIRIYALIIPFLAINAFYAVAFLSMQRGRLRAGLSIVYGMANLILPICAILWRKNISLVLGGFLAAEIIGAILYAVFFHRNVLKDLATRAGETAKQAVSLARGAKEVFGFGFLFFFANLGWNLINSVDRIMVKFYLPAEELAFYGMAALIITALTIVSSTAGTALIPSLTAAVDKGDRQLFRKQIWNTTRLGLMVLIPAASILFTLSTDIYEIVLPRYISSAGPLRILVFIGFIDILCRTAWASLVAYGKGGKAAIAYISAASLNIVLNIVLIPRMGIVGAALATLSSFVALAIVLQAMMTAVSGVRSRITDLIHPLLISLVFPALGYVLAGAQNWIRVIVIILAGIAIFVVIALVTRLIRSEDIARVTEIIEKRPDGPLKKTAYSLLDILRKFTR